MLEAEDRAEADAPVGGVDVVVVGEEGEARWFADAGRVAVGAFVADEHLVDRGAEGEMVSEADVGGEGGGGGEVELAGLWWIRVSCGWGREGAFPTGESRSDGDTKREVLAGVAGTKAEVCCEEGASNGGRGDRTGIGLIAGGGDEVEVTAKRDAELHAGATGVGAAVDAAGVIGAETERGIEEEEIGALGGLDVHGVLEGAEEW